MNRCYEDKLPEVYKHPFFELLKGYQKISSLDNRQQKFIIEFLLQKLRRIFGNKDYYSSSEEEYHDIVEIWIIGLQDMTFKRLMDGLYAIMIGRTEYIDYPPKSYLGFRKACVENSFDSNIFEPENPKTIENRIYSEEVAEENINKIKQLIRPLTGVISYG